MNKANKKTMMNKLILLWNKASFWKRVFFIYILLLVIQFLIILFGGYVSSGEFNCGDFGGRCSAFSLLLNGLVLQLFLIIEFFLVKVDFAVAKDLSGFYLLVVYLILLSIPLVVAYGLRKKQNNIAAVVVISPLILLVVYYIYKFIF